MSRLRFVLLLLFLLPLGCQNRLWVVEEVPCIPACKLPERPPRIALVLGGGGAKGLAHIGVIEELEKAGIRPDLIVGCSAGSLIGALYAYNPNYLYLKKCMMGLKRKHFLQMSLLDFRYGLAKGSELRQTVRRHLGSCCFEELQIPLIVVATDLRTGHLVRFGSGPILPTIHASCALPLCFSPVKMYGCTLVDGGVADPVPVQVAKDAGADIIIAVDVSCSLSKNEPEHLFGVAARSMEILYIEHTRNCLKDADIVIRPKLEDFGFFEDGSNMRIYQAGREAAQIKIPEIVQLLAK